MRYQYNNFAIYTKIENSFGDQMITVADEHENIIYQEQRQERDWFHGNKREAEFLFYKAQQNFIGRK